MAILSVTPWGMGVWMCGRRAALVCSEWDPPPHAPSEQLAAGLLQRRLVYSPHQYH